MQVACLALVELQELGAGRSEDPATKIDGLKE